MGQGGDQEGEGLECWRSVSAGGASTWIYSNRPLQGKLSVTVLKCTVFIGSIAMGRGEGELCNSSYSLHIEASKLPSNAFSLSLVFATPLWFVNIQLVVTNFSCCSKLAVNQ